MIIAPKKRISKFILWLRLCFVVFFLVGPVESLPDFWRHVQSRPTTKRFKCCIHPMKNRTYGTVQYRIHPMNSWTYDTIRSSTVFVQWTIKLTIRSNYDTIRAVFIQWAIELTVRYNTVSTHQSNQKRAEKVDNKSEFRNTVRLRYGYDTDMYSSFLFPSHTKTTLLQYSDVRQKMFKTQSGITSENQFAIYHILAEKLQ